MNDQQPLTKLEILSGLALVGILARGTGMSILPDMTKAKVGAAIYLAKALIVELDKEQNKGEKSATENRD